MILIMIKSNQIKSNNHNEKIIFYFLMAIVNPKSARTYSVGLEWCLGLALLYYFKERKYVSRFSNFFSSQQKGLFTGFVHRLWCVVVLRELPLLSSFAVLFVAVRILYSMVLYCKREEFFFAQTPIWICHCILLQTTHDHNNNGLRWFGKTNTHDMSRRFFCFYSNSRFCLLHLPLLVAVLAAVTSSAVEERYPKKKTHTHTAEGCLDRSLRGRKKQWRRWRWWWWW